jgi:Uma2 family endonuclease
MHEPIDGNYPLRSSLGGLRREPLPTMYDLPSEEGEVLTPEIIEKIKAYADRSPGGRRQKPLPTMYDLPSEDPEEPGLPDEFHDYQPKLLRETYQPPNAEAEPFFIGIDLNLYYDANHTLWHKRPDWFLALGVETSDQQSKLRLSYVTWEERVNPFLVVELLSDSTEAEDLGLTLREANKPPTKWQVYEQVLRIPYYAVYDRKTLNFRMFRLVGTRYEELVLVDQRYWFEDLKLGLGVWSGRQSGIIGQWLRWYDASGSWLQTSVERADQADERADQANLEASQAKVEANQAKKLARQAEERAERLAAQLRSLGIDPND